eukprot:5061035-Alexandrium_andersonii.AAC.1
MALSAIQKSAKVRGLHSPLSVCMPIRLSAYPPIWRSVEPTVRLHCSPVRSSADPIARLPAYPPTGLLP